MSQMTHWRRAICCGSDVAGPSSFQGMRARRWRAAVGPAIVVALLVACGGGEATTEQRQSGRSPRSLRPDRAGARPIVVEVVETGSRSVHDEHLVDGGVSTRASFFETDGYLYERGTLTCTDGTCDGVVYDELGVPSPEFPDRLIGSWTCYGTEVAEAVAAVTGRPRRPPSCSTWVLWWASRPSSRTVSGHAGGGARDPLTAG
jgi:hypothetical protein